MKIRSKLFSSFIFLTAIPILFVGTLIFSNARQLLTQSYLTSLESIADSKVKQITGYMNERINDAHLVTYNESVQDWFLRDDEFYRNPQTDEYMQTRQVLDTAMSNLIEFEQYYDIALVNLRGNVIYRAKDINSNLQVGQPFPKIAYQAFLNGQKAITFSDVFRIDESQGFYMFIIAPVQDKQGALIGVIVLHRDMKEIFDLIQDTTGLGETGETLLGKFEKSHLGSEVVEHTAEREGDHVLYLNPLRHDPEAALKREAYADDGSHLPIYKASTGQTGSGILKDYRGEEIIAAWRYIPMLDWGIAAKIDTKEAFSSINAFQIVSSLITFLAICLIFIVAYALSKSISKPILLLTDVTKRLSEGHLSATSLAVLSHNNNNNNEIQDLSSAFSEMARRLHYSLEENKDIVLKMPYALLILDSDGLIQLANHKASELIGVSTSVLTGQPFNNFIHFANFKQINIIDLIDKGKVYDLDAQLIVKGHKPISIVFSGVKLAEHSKNVRYVIVIKDVRELKKYAEKRIKEITPILNRISLGDFSQKIEISSFKDEFTDVLVAIDLMAENLRALIEENQKKNEQLEDSKQKIEHSNRVLTSFNKQVKEEKAKAESILSNMGEGLLVIDSKGNIAEINNSAEHMFEESSANALGKPFIKLFTFKNDKGLIITSSTYPISDVVVQKKQIFTTTYFVKKDGSLIPLATTLSPIFFGKTFYGVIGTFRDITKEMEVDKAKNEFVSLASHQLRTPLTAIKWLIQVTMAKGSLNNSQTEFLNDALSSNSRMINLVNDLLNVSRLDTGILTVNPVQADVNNLLKQLINEVRPTALKKGITIKFNDYNGKLMAYFDTQLVTQVASVFLTNSIDYSHEKQSVQVFLSKKNNNFEISVKDSGVGISKADQKNLFNKFFRSAEAAKLSTHGSGLGLYIVKRILDVCKGSVRCDSVLGKGSTFTVSFPLKMKAVTGGKGLIRDKIS